MRGVRAGSTTATGFGRRGRQIRTRAFAGLVLWLAAMSGTLAADTAPSTDLPDLSAIRADIYSGEYENAVNALQALTDTVHHADLYNLLAFSLRKLKRYDEAARWYKEALYYDPGHRAALEYQGELFLAMGDRTAAEKNLELLKLLCHPSGCEEHDKLARALAGKAD